MSFKVGMSKEIITPFIKGVTMLGYGKTTHQAEFVAQELHARSCTISKDHHFIIFCNLEICFITHSLKREILKIASEKIPNLNESNLILNSQHTHSAPGGISEYGLYNLSNNGLCRKVFNTYVENSAKCIIDSFHNLKECKSISFKESSYPSETKVAFNRSILAYLSNIENSETKQIERNKAIDRRVKFLEFHDDKLLGFINIFGVHSTSIGSQNRYIHPDNKGDAANLSEKEFKDTVCIYMQGNAGDVSPNFIKEVRTYREYRGNHQEDQESSLYNGSLQANFSKEIISQTAKIPLNDSLKTCGFYLDLSKMTASQKYEDFYSKNNLKTTSGYIGSQMLRGSISDGKSMNRFLYKILELLFKFINKKNINHDSVFQSPKTIAIDTGSNSIAGSKKPKILKVLKFIDPLVKILYTQLNNDALKTEPWIQEVHYFNLVLIDSVLIISLPLEPTTTAGLRLEKNLIEVTKSYGIKKVVLMPYSNSYCGYLTTPEEYEYQDYEGGHSIFGKWTLPCLQTQLEKRVLDFLNNKEIKNQAYPMTFNKDELELRTNNKY